jgi:DNA-binding response OmpR family regulator
MTTKSILIIEEDPSLGRIFQVCFKDLAGWEVILANSLQACLEALMTKRPDAILLNVSTQRVERVDSVSAIKKHTLGKSIPVLLLTLKSSWFSPQQLAEMGVMGVVSNPYDPVSLPQQVSQLLERLGRKSHA